MKKQLLLGMLAAAAAGAATAKDIDVEQYVKKYWTTYQNKQFEIGNGVHENF